MLLVQSVHLRVHPAAALPPSPHTPFSSGRAAAHATATALLAAAASSTLAAAAFAAAAFAAAAFAAAAFATPARAIFRRRRLWLRLGGYPR